MTYRAQVAKFFKPSIDAILEAIKGIAGDLDPKNTVISDTLSNTLLLANYLEKVRFSSRWLRCEPLVVPRSRTRARGVWFEALPPRYAGVSSVLFRSSLNSGSLQVDQE